MAKQHDGVSLATAAAALLVSSAAISPKAVDAAEPASTPVKVSLCQGLHSCHGESACKGYGNDVGAGQNNCGGMGFVSFSSGKAEFSAQLCEKLGGTQVAAKAISVEANTASDDAIKVTYCDDVFSCGGYSACKGNSNANCAGKNGCGGEGYVGISTGKVALSEKLCEKLGGTVIKKL
ncbi:hypothetical protein NBRC116493_23820 [Aurantivibrio infirmus]